MRTTRALIAGFGTTGSLVAAVACVFVVASAVVAFNGWPGSGIGDSIDSLFVKDQPAVAFDASGPRVVAGPGLGGGRPGPGSSGRSGGGSGPGNGTAGNAGGANGAATGSSSGGGAPGVPGVSGLPDTSGATNSVGGAVQNTSHSVGNTTSGVTNQVGQTVGGANQPLGDTVSQTGQS